MAPSERLKKPSKKERISEARRPFWAAARHNRLQCLNRLLPISDPLAVDQLGFTALQFAAVMGNAAAVEKLLPVSDVARGEIGG